MPDKEAQINFDAPATLRKWPSLNNERINASLGARPYMIIEGTLDECIQRFMSQPASQHHLYEIHTAPQSDLVSAVLGRRILLNLPGCGIFSKPKFPPGAFRHQHSQVATDTFDYVATDTWGNTATSTRTVIIDAATASTSTTP
jgi:hypothetical protein